MVHTIGIMYSSSISSKGMSTLSGGMMQPSVSFGFGSYNFSKGELGYLGKKGNSTFENIGYFMGAITNASDIYRYATFGRLSQQQKVDKLKRMYGDSDNNNIIYDNEKGTGKDGVYCPTNDQIMMRDGGLNKGIAWAKSTYEHEWIHRIDNIHNNMDFFSKSNHPFLDSRAYYWELMNSKNNRINYNQFIKITNQYIKSATAAGVPISRIPNYTLGMWIRSMWF